MPNDLTPNFKGFTLIELLVSIAIIAMVFGVVISSTAQIQKNGRNAKRESDLRNVQGALQQYFADRSYFPAGDILSGSSLTDCIGVDTTANPNCFASKTYLSKIPKDPNTSEYCYLPLRSANSNGSTSDCDNTTDNKCYFYKLFALVEDGSTAFVDSYCSKSYNFQISPN